MNGRGVVLTLSVLVLVVVGIAVRAVLSAEYDDPHERHGVPDAAVPASAGDFAAATRERPAAAIDAQPGGDDVEPPRGRERLDPEHGWQELRAVAVDVASWRAAPDEIRRHVASVVERRFPDMRFSELRTYSSGGLTNRTPVFRHRLIGAEFVLIPGGTFLMGSAADEPGRHALEAQHEVTVSPFLIARTELTQASWKRVFEFVPSRFEGDDLPLERVSHSQAARYCARVGLRLPTEAEWEFACRGGSRSAWSFGDDAQHVAQHAWFSGNSGRRTHPVAQKSPNAFGLHDMHGNVWEWCADFHGAYPEGPRTDPRGPAAGSHRVIRGGSWWDKALDVRSATRSRYQKPEFNIGFRPALSLE